MPPWKCQVSLAADKSGTTGSAKPSFNKSTFMAERVIKRLFNHNRRAYLTSATIDMKLSGGPSGKRGKLFFSPAWNMFRDRTFIDSSHYVCYARVSEQSPNIANG
jgi:hypothetical protein